MSKTLLGAGVLALLSSLACAQTNATGDRQVQVQGAQPADKTMPKGSAETTSSSIDMSSLGEATRTHNPSVSTLPGTAGGTDPQRTRQR